MISWAVNHARAHIIVQRHYSIWLPLRVSGVEIHTIRFVLVIISLIADLSELVNVVIIDLKLQGNVSPYMKVILLNLWKLTVICLIRIKHNFKQIVLLVESIYDNWWWCRRWVVLLWREGHFNHVYSSFTNQRLIRNLDCFRGLYLVAHCNRILRSFLNK